MIRACMARRPAEEGSGVEEVVATADRTSTSSSIIAIREREETSSEKDSECRYEALPQHGRLLRPGVEIAVCEEGRVT